MCANCNDLNDDLSDLLTPGFEAREPVTPPANYKPVSFTEACPKCNGRGVFVSWSGRTLGPCFNCKGKGSKTFKTSSADRATARAQREERTEAKRAANLEAFKAEHADAYAWLLADGSSFAASLLEGVAKFGALTDNQLAAVRRSMEKAAARKVEAEARVANAPAITVAKIEEAFAAARASGLKRLALNLAAFTFKPAGANSRNPGAIYVTGDAYLGKIVGGKFFGSRECTPEIEAAILAVAANPEAAAVAYGKQTGSCSCCGRELTDPVSVERGIGPICAQKWGW